mgnify:CR=1 FL=1
MLTKSGDRPLGYQSVDGERHIIWVNEQRVQLTQRLSQAGRANIRRAQE